MESQPQSPEFRNNPENFHPWIKNTSILIVAYQALAFNLPLSICLLVSSADNLCKRFRPRSGPTKCRN